MKLYEQADRTGDKVTYSWMLDAPYKMRKELLSEGWKWIKGVGCRGSFVTNELITALDTARKYKLGAPESNGTHTAVKAQMSDFTEFG